MSKEKKNAEQERLDAHYANQKDWLRWGPYLSERQWGTVREDYSPDGQAWQYFPHDHARSRAYRWGEDGLAGISDRYCNICFGISLWNGKDPILKERLFGLSGPEGNHGEDVKELYYYLENTPSHSYMKQLYKYPQNEFPYAQRVRENGGRGKEEPEFELLDTGLFENNAYFDVVTEYAKADAEDLLISITVTNRGGEEAKLVVLPTLWFRNLWSFMDMPEQPKLQKQEGDHGLQVSVEHTYVGNYIFYFDPPSQLIFTENETNRERIFNSPNDHHYKKDFFHHTVIQDDYKAASQKDGGTKCAPVYSLELSPGESKILRLRLSMNGISNPLGQEYEEVFSRRRQESKTYFEELLAGIPEDYKNIQKQAFSGLLWSKQYYNYEVEQWLKGDPKEPPPPSERMWGRNNGWKTLRIHDILAMPDKWEYPWFAAWDSAFHCVSLALIDPGFAKNQLLLFTKEWYMAPNGQIPAYEWSLGDINPPVQAWAALQVYQLDKKRTGSGDLIFLKRMFNKLTLNFTWWVNREDSFDNNVFEGGFLGLDNIGVFDRSNGIPGNGILEQVDGTSWMALYCLNMLEMALEISLEDESFEDMAMKYFGHFVFIAEALNQISLGSRGSWDESEGFFYDTLILPEGPSIPIKVRSISGMLSLCAVLNIRKEYLDKLPRFRRSVEWFRKHRIETGKYQVMEEYAPDRDVLLSLVPKERFAILMTSLLKEEEFLSPFGIRSLSKIHSNPYTISIEGTTYSIDYEPAESTTGLFGGNSNWRGPIWFPMNYLFIDSFMEYATYFGDSLKFACPSGSNVNLNMKEIGDLLCQRLLNIFLKDGDGQRPVNNQHSRAYADEHFRDLIVFYEYFHGEDGRGMGASHQTGWTALVANLIEKLHA